MLLLSAWLAACTVPEETDPTDKEGGGGSTHTDDSADTEETERARWTFLVFMNGDNDLELYVTHDLNELEIVGASEGVNVLVQADRSPGYAEDDGDWTGTRRYAITGDEDLDTVSSVVLEEMGEVDMGDPDVLTDFLLWADENYPAEHMALVLWDHGDGWLLTDDAVAGAVSWDETSGNDISVAEGELASALTPLVERRGPLDVIAFDACNMASWEIAYALSPYGSYLVASEAVVGGEGLQYGPALELLRDSPEATAQDLALNLAEMATSQGGEWTYSATDLSRAGELAAAMDALAGYLLEADGGVEAFEEARDSARAVERSWREWYIDLADFADVLATSEDAELAAAGEDLAVAISSSVIGNHSTEPLTWVGGLTGHMDTEDQDYLELYSDGAGATWAQDTRWDDLLIGAAGMR